MENNYYTEVYQHIFKLIRFLDDPKQDQNLLNEAGVDLDPKLFPLFVTIANTAPTQVSSLVGLFNRPPSTLSRQIDRLEKSGLIQTFQDDVDTRIRKIILSPLGLEINSAISSTRLRILEAAFEGLTSSEKAAFLTAFRKVDHFISQR